MKNGKLNKEDIKKLNEHLSNTTEEKNKLTESIESYNQKVEELSKPLLEALARFNEAVDAANEWRQDIQATANDHYESKTEKWQESDSGQNYLGWVENVLDSEFAKWEIDLPEKLELPEVDHYEQFMEIQNGPD